MNLRSRLHLLPLASVLALAACSAADDSTTSGDEQRQTEVDPTLEAAARAMLKVVSKEIDANHLAKYGLSGDLDDQFVQAVKIEYDQEPELLTRRLQTVASMVMFSVPEQKTDASVGRITAFHGMDDA